MLEAARRLIAVGVSSGKIREDYVLLGHRHVRDTECPGQALFDEISKWPHFSVSSPQNPLNYEQFLETHKMRQNNISITN
jgi:N-acetylmuramoyl-L-alanine amidase